MRHLIMSISLSFLMAGMSLAQLPREETRLGSRIPKKVEYESTQITEIRFVSARFADCVVKKRHYEARRLLLEHASEEENDAERKRLISRISDGDCLIQAARAFSDVEMKFPGDTMRYALAEALIHADLANRPVIDVTKIPPLSHPVLDESSSSPKPGEKLSTSRLALLQARRSDQVAAIALSQFGECVVRKQPAGSNELLQTVASSPAEATAFVALQPALSGCLDSGSTVRLNKSLARGTVALNYFRLANATVRPPLGKTN